MEIKEIGEAREIIQKYLLHKSGSPYEEALMLKELIDLGLSQKEIKELTGFSQSQISKKLSLLSLVPELQERLRKGELRFSAAYELTKLPPKVQREFAKKKRVYLKDVQEALRRQAVTREVLDLLETPLDLETEDVENTVKRVLEEHGFKVVSIENNGNVWTIKIKV